jgi:nucleoside-diphosphate-sugar epimerase
MPRGGLQRMTSSPVLLTGATGYVGGRLLKRFESLGRPVRCPVRRPEFLKARAGTSTEVASGDVLDAAGLASSMAGIHTRLTTVFLFVVEPAVGRLHFPADPFDPGLLAKARPGERILL